MPVEPQQMQLSATLIFVAALAACSTPSNVPTPGPSPDDDAVRQLTLLFINDFHGALYEQPLRDDPELAVGGLPWLAGAIESVRNEVEAVVLLDGGDSFLGSWPVNATRGMGSVDVFNLLGVDVTVVGNHEFDYGPGGANLHPLRGALESAILSSDYNWVTANVFEVDPETGQERLWAPQGLRRWVVIERNDVRVGIIGLTTTETPQTTLFHNVVDLRFADPVTILRDVIPEVEAEGVDVIVVLGHLMGSCEPAGYLELGEPCLPSDEVGRILTELPRGSIDILALGHSHSLMAHRWEDTLVVENRANGHVLGRIDLVVREAGLDLDSSTIHPPWPLLHQTVDPGCDDGEYPLDSLPVGGRLVEPSAAAFELVQRLEVEAGSLCDPIGCANERFVRQYEAECPVGNVVVDAIQTAFPGADVVVQNSGGLRADIVGGVVRREDLQAVMPFDNRLLLVELNGQQLEQLFTIGTSGAHGVLQVAGASYRYDPNETGGTDIDGDGQTDEWETDRLCYLLVDGHSVDAEQTYRVVVSDFLYSGGDHLGPVLSDSPILQEGPLIRDVLFQYVEDQELCLDDEGPLVDVDNPRIELGPCQPEQTHP